MKKILWSIFLLLGSVVLLAASAQATTVTFDNYVKFAGTPALPTFSVTIEDTGPNSVKITMNNLTGTDAQRIFSEYFNIVPPIPVGLSATSFSFVSGVQATGQGPTPGVQLQEDKFQPDGDGLFDLVFTWPNNGAGTFDPGHNSIYTATGIHAVDFIAQSTSSAGHGPYYAAVEQSSWWGQGSAPTSSVPEPTTLLLIGSGLIGFAGYGRRKFFKK